MIFIWLPLVRGLMDGPSYSWAWGPLVGGRGIGGDYWLLVSFAAFALGLLYLGWRGARQPFHWLLLLWHLPLAVGVTLFSLAAGDSLRFRGDTLGIDISLAWLGPLLFGGGAVLALYWVLRDLRTPRQRNVLPWTPTNRRFLLAVLVIVPVQLVLLRFGEPHGVTDQLGVMLTLMQWVLLNLALIPWRVSSGSPQGAVRE